SMKNFLNSHFKIDISFTVAFVGFFLFFTLNFIKLVKMDTPNNTRIKTTKLINLLKNGLKKSARSNEIVTCLFSHSCKRMQIS
ncbi:TPA: hypothetical protein ACJHH3_002429, partial [Staphylococcus pseudintermedius]